jgi:broad specificity phosphatase PhoE
MIYLLRHAHAGNKQTWSGPDERRPLSAAGQREAAGLVIQLGAHPITTIVASPALRCQQTIQPLAAYRRLPVTCDQRLRVDATVEQAATLLFRDDLDGVVLCTHGELIGQLLGMLREGGTPISQQARWPKASTWLLRVAGARVTDATYLPPLRATHRFPDQIPDKASNLGAARSQGPADQAAQASGCW